MHSRFVFLVLELLILSWCVVVIEIETLSLRSFNTVLRYRISRVLRGF